MNSNIRLRNEAVGLAFALLLQGMVSAQEAVSPRQIPDSPSAVRSKLLYAQAREATPGVESPDGGVPSGSSRAVDPASQTGKTESTSQSASPKAEAPVPDMPSSDDAASNPSAAADTAPARYETQTIVQQPIGTAAAEVLPVTGVAASRPAGAALAPARQRRVRSVLIRVGSLVGAGVAIGTTMALSQGSPSRPPGSH